MQKPKLGFVLGKFMPPHQGHVYMCEFARQYCEKLVILVCSMPDEPIPGKLRYQWMNEMFPDCSVVWTNAILPQEPIGEDPWFWQVWKAEVKQAMAKAAFDYEIQWQYPDVVFASEAYGHRLAKEVGARFVPVDMDRTTRTVSGTAIRENPFKNWSYIPPVVRPYFVKRVTLFGPESTGKTTLAKELTRYYDTIMVPEYGRVYIETFGTSITTQDLNNIAAGHQASVAAAKRQANRILIEDTDPVMTAVWSDMLLGYRDPWFDSFKDYSDLYLLNDIDIPWIDDGTRYFPTDDSRRKFFSDCEYELKSRGVNYVKVSGTLGARMLTARAAINELLN
jgi:HTH-type transcriptional repressor of NAD biosynthesis genes